MPNRIRELRKNMGLSQTELGDLVSASTRQIGYWETDRGLSADDAVKLADVFSCSLDSMLCREAGGRDRATQDLLGAVELLNDDGRERVAELAKAMVRSGMYSRGSSGAEPAALYGVSVVRLFEGKPKAMFTLKTADREEALAAFRDAVSRADAERIEWLRVLKLGEGDQVLDLVEEWSNPNTSVAFGSWD